MLLAAWRHAAEEGVLRFREEAVVEVRSIPCERVQQQAVERMVGVQGEVIAVTETASQEPNLQNTIRQTLLDLVKSVKIVRQKGISERLGEQFGVVEESQNSSQESVEIVLQKQMSGRTREQIGVNEAPETASQDPRFAAYSGVGPRGQCRGCENCFSGVISGRPYELFGVIEVSNNSIQENVSNV